MSDSKSISSASNFSPIFSIFSFSKSELRLSIFLLLVELFIVKNGFPGIPTKIRILKNADKNRLPRKVFGIFDHGIQPSFDNFLKPASDTDFGSFSTGLFIFIFGFGVF